MVRVKRRLSMAQICHLRSAFLLACYVTSSVSLAQQTSCYDKSDVGALVGRKGQTVYYDFGDHRDVQPLRVFEAILTHPEIEPPKIQKAVADLKRVYADLLKIQNQRVVRLTSLLLSGGVNWISPEGYTRETLEKKDDNGNTRLERYWALKKRLLESGISAEDVGQMLLLSDGPLIYVWQSNPQIQPIVGIEGLEDVDIDDKTSKYAQFMFMVLDGLKGEVPKHLSQLQYDQLVSTFNRATAEYTLIPKEEMDALSKGISDPVYKVMVDALLAQANEFIDLNGDRESAIIRSIKKLKGVGLIQFGRLHEKGLKQRFLSDCKS